MTSKSTTPITASSTVTIPGTQFMFNTAPIETFEEQQYTLGVIVQDHSGSVYGVRGDIYAMNEAVDTALKASSAKHTIQVRRSAFTGRFRNNVKEMHGFLPATAINPSVHFPIDNTYGNYGDTPLFDGAMEAILAAKTQAMMLINQQGIPLVNLVIYIITDGGDTGSAYSPADIKAAVEQILAEGEIESVVTILVGVGCPQGGYNRAKLEDFYQKANLTKFIPFDEVTPAELNKVAYLASQSFITSSQALGSGSPSKFVSGLQSGVSGGGLTI